MSVSLPALLLPPEAGLYLFHHVFLPPKLPQEDDYDAKYDGIILDTVIRALQGFKAHLSTQQDEIITSVVIMISRLRETLGSRGDVTEKALQRALDNLDIHGGYLPIHIRSQNAAVLITRNSSTFDVETFELSPPNKAVYATVGRLQRQFPGPSFSLDQGTFNEPGFRKTIAQTLAKLSHQSVPGTKPKIKKARQQHDEERDTVSPIMVTEFFTAFLRSRCTSINGLQIHKNTREEVLYLKSRLPWRRSSLWLLVRVVLQLVLRRLFIHGQASDDVYKQFMVYYMSAILNTCNETLGDEYRYVMLAKVARRLHKLDLSQCPAWFPSVRATLERGNNALKESWRGIIRQNSSQWGKVQVAKLKFDKDIDYSLCDLEKWIEGIYNRQHLKGPADFRPTSKLLLFHPLELPSLADMDDAEFRIYNLAAVEHWVDVNLDIWLQTHLGGQDTCKHLGSLIQSYHEIASRLYLENPEAISVMYLTMLELWVACDKSAIHNHPLLGEYDPRIPMDVVESFVLPYRSQLERLAHAEDYMRQRQQNIRYRASNIFRDFGSLSCFSVRFFDESAAHQALFATVQDQARRNRAAKMEELRKKHQRYEELIGLADETECAYYDFTPDWRFDFTEQRHSPHCKSCGYKNQAKAISIDVHEWPLPADKLQAKTVVFELNIPRAYAFWRDTTVSFLLTILHAEYSAKENPRSQHRLDTYQGLSPFFTSIDVSQRVCLLSENKPHEGTHRRDKPIIDVTAQDVCLNNGLRFRYYDDKVQCFVRDFKYTHEVSTMCTYKVPQSSTSLQQFLFRPADNRNGLSPNSVIATQDACPEAMSLEEYKSLCSLPYGIDIQWENILRQLAMPSVVFKKVETHLFILQIIRQAGPSAKSSVLRQGHTILDNNHFVVVLLAQIKNAAGRIEENWESAQELCALISLTQRVLSCSSSIDIQHISLEHLSYLRKIAFQWVKLIREKASNADSDTRRNDLVARSAYIALICVATFDSDGGTLGRLLEDELDASVFLQCSIIIHDKRGLLDIASDNLLSILYYRWQSLSYRCHHILAQRATQEQTMIDDAIRAAWAAYRKGFPWFAALERANHWLFTRMMPELTNQDDVLVHLNLLTGELLINGQPLARLPVDYERHETYKILFGQSPVEVMPSDVPGMQFSAQRKHMGHTIYIGREPVPNTRNFDLCVRALDNDQIWEFVPARLLAGLFPDTFLEDYVHWYNLYDRYIEFRSMSEPWKSSGTHWRLEQRRSQSWSLSKGETFLVNIQSETATVLSGILAPIERASRVLCKLHISSSRLEVQIPRLRLSFEVQPGQSPIRSRQFRGMCIDADQSLGTLVGLYHKLILKDHSSGDRMVLVPAGDVAWAKGGRHVTVRIRWQAASKAHIYMVDTQLGRLTDNGSLQSKLMLCYLHAVTTFCIPDPLTSKSGTEQSLSILRSASTRSFSSLQPEDSTILLKLAELTPERRYYPANERVMQSITWQKDLGALAHHHDFRTEVLDIINHDRRMRIFYPDLQVSPLALPGVAEDLLQRDKIRTSTFRASDYGAEAHLSEFDRQYTERGRDYQSKGCFQVVKMCRILYEDIESTQVKSHQGILSSFWKFLSQHTTMVHGTNAVVEGSKIKYDATWLVEPAEFVSTYWCGIHRLLRSDTFRPEKHQMMIWLSTLAFMDKVPMAILEVLAALYVIPDMSVILPPTQPFFQLSKGYNLNEIELRSQLDFTRRDVTPESSHCPKEGENYEAFNARIRRLRKENRERTLEHFLASLRMQWPTPAPSTPNDQGTLMFDNYFDAQNSMDIVREKFSNWFYNKELRHYISELASLFSSQPVKLVPMPSCSHPDPVRPATRKHRYVSLDDILDHSLGTPPVLQTEPPRLEDLLHADTEGPEPQPRLLTLIRALELQAVSDYETCYVENLRDSTKSLLDSKRNDRLIKGDDELKEAFLGYLLHCEAHFHDLHNAITSRMTFSNVANDLNCGSPTRCLFLKTLASTNIGPRYGTDLFLHQLTRKRWHLLPQKWKVCFIAYGCSITTLQRARRLVGLLGHREDLIRELQNSGHTNWDPYDFPESLLLEIENGILIRDVQEQITKQIRNIQPGGNAVMQLNMGEGKSSVIVPISAAASADGSCLVRVFVAKAQSQQMFEILVSKLGGLLGRRVYLLPISRSLKIHQTEATEIERMCLECMAEGGVLLVQPEQILSLKLMCLECFNLGKEATGQSLLKILEFFRVSSRDLIDESDENFSVRFELIYTMGAQQPLELSPQRWSLTQQLLDLVRKYAPGIRKTFPQSVELDEQRSGCFPRTRLLDKDAALELFGKIAEHVCDYGIDSLPISRQPEMTRQAIRSYILNPSLSMEEVSAVEDCSATGFWTPSTKEPLLLLRGLLAGGILAFCFGQKRWRVNYGPDNNRRPATKLSVPYRAKDNPAPRSEFSHPEIVIVLTCLSYYYSGLSDNDLILAFDHMVKGDQADTEYKRWVDDAPSLPHLYRHLGGINLQDQHHCLEHIFPGLRFSKGAIDYFLAHIVFPKEMREFPNKLSASGWDLGEIKALPTVGFSGTNDSRVTLPLSVKQLDLPEQNHTNALVLEYLLKPENSVAATPPRNKPSISDAQALLEMVMDLDPPIQVILDVGAQILEYTNLEVAESWLRMVPNSEQIQAVVFVNHNDEICVVDRSGLIEPLRVSPFAKQLEACFVYLDEAHTRGIDLRLPQTYRAAVTLGAGITKDKLVQACMRMRKLGKGQSVVFCVSQEIRNKILSATGKFSEKDISTLDVLHWAVSETWIETQRSIPLWATQGRRFERQCELWTKARRDAQAHMSKSLADEFLEPESQSLEQRYRPVPKGVPINPIEPSENENIRLIRDRCREFANVEFLSTQLQEEQERELAPEVEQERQVQRPPPANPAQHHLHPDLASFVSSGLLKRSSAAFMPAFEALKGTTAALHLALPQLPGGLLVTRDFARTIQGQALSTFDLYQRPVQWILTSCVEPQSKRKAVEHTIIISPYEANALHSRIMESKRVSMHLYAPRQNQGFLPIDRLNLYSTPTSSESIEISTTVRVQLNLFAGQLYISSYGEYQEICDFLGVASVAATEGLTVAADGFITVGNEQSIFGQSPVKFFKLLMSQIRKNGQEIDKTHLGMLLDGKLLDRCDLEGSSQMPMATDLSFRPI